MSPPLILGERFGARDDVFFLLNEELLRTPESSKSRGGMSCFLF